MKDLVCDNCLKDIEEYIETDNGEFYCSDFCLLDDLEEMEKLHIRLMNNGA